MYSLTSSVGVPIRRWRSPTFLLTIALIWVNSSARAFSADLDRVCEPVAPNANADRLTRSSGYALLRTTGPDGVERELVATSASAGAILTALGADLGRGNKPWPYGRYLSKDAAKRVGSERINVQVTRYRIHTDLPSQPKCYDGGFVEPTLTERLWSDATPLADLLDRFFDESRVHDKPTGTYAMKRQAISKLTCADLAVLLRCDVDVYQTVAFGLSVTMRRERKSGTE